MSVKRCILRFFAIILFVLGMQNISILSAYATIANCATSTQVSYATSADDWGCSSFSPVIQNKTTKESCSKCNSGYSTYTIETINTVTCTGGACGSYENYSGGVPYESYCSPSSINIVGCKSTEDSSSGDDGGGSSGDDGGNETTPAPTNCEAGYYLYATPKFEPPFAHGYAYEETAERCQACPENAYCPGGTESPAYHVNFMNTDEAIWSSGFDPDLVTISSNNWYIGEQKLLEADISQIIARVGYNLIGFCIPKYLGEEITEDNKYYLYRTDSQELVAIEAWYQADLDSSNKVTVYADWEAKSIKCNPGTYLEANTATCKPCPAGYYCTGGTFTYDGSDMGITGVCASGYSTGGATSSTCTACTSGYTASGANNSDHDNINDCKKTITLNKNGGTGTVNSVSGTSNAKIICSQGTSCNFGSSSSLTQNGYTFNGGWGTTSSCTTTTTSFTTPIDSTYYACKTANTYTVVYNANGGTGTTASSSHTYDTAKALTANGFTRTGYTFNGWTTAANGTGTVYADKASVKNLTTTNGGTVTLYAQWKLQSITCVAGEYLPKGATACTTCPAGYACPGGTFSYNTSTDQGNTECDNGKYQDATGQSTCKTCLAGSVSADTGPKTACSNCFSGLYQDLTGQNTCKTCSAGTYTPSNGSAHDSCIPCATGYNSTAGAYSCTANTYSVKYNANGGSGTMSDSTHTYGTAKALTDNTFTRTGYTFNGWNTAADGTGTSYTNQQRVANLTTTNGGTVNLYAQWDPNEITINYTHKGEIIHTQTCTYGETFYVYGGTPTGYYYETGYWEMYGNLYSPNQKITCNYDNLGVYQGTVTAEGDLVQNSCTVRYYLNDGSGNYEDVSRKFDDMLGLKTGLTRTGYTFAGWNTKADGTGIPYIDGEAVQFCYGLHDIIPLYAQWTANTYTITLNGNGVSDKKIYTKYDTGAYLDNNLTQQMATSGKNKIQVSTLTYTVKFHTDGDNTISDFYSHYSFAGYYQSKSTSSTQYISSLGFITQAGIDAAKSYTNNTTWYAQWNTASSKIILPTPTKTGFKFNGWYTARIGGTKIGDAGFTYLPTSDITLYAKWTCNEGQYLNGDKCENYFVDIEYVCNESDCIGGDDSSTCYYGSDCTLYENHYEKKGYTFSNWKIDINGETFTVSSGGKISAEDINNVINAETNGNIYYAVAQWKPAPITITYQCEGKTVDTQTCYVTDTECKLKEPTCTKNGYNFDLWSVQAGTYAGDYYAAGDNLNGIIKYLATQDGFWTDGANITATALWEPNEYTVTLDPNVGDKQGLADGHTTSVTATYGQPMPSADMPHFQLGYNFEGYYTSKTGGTQYYDINGNSTRNWDIAQNSTLFAQWSVHSGKLAFDANGGSGTLPTSPSTCTYDSCVVPSSSLTKTGYTFAGWSFNHEDAGQIIVQPGENVGGYFADISMNGQTLTLTAVWEANKYTVTYACSTTDATPPSATYATYDQKFTMAENTCVRHGYTFNHWRSTNNERYSAGYEFTWKFTNDKTFIAQWEAITCDKGQYLNNDNKCVKCPAGSYCPGDNTQYACPDDLYGELDPTSPVGATSNNECYVEKSCLYTSDRYSCTYVADAAMYVCDASICILSAPITYSCDDEGCTGNAPSEPTACYSDKVCTLPENTYSRYGYNFTGWKVICGTCGNGVLENMQPGDFLANLFNNGYPDAGIMISPMWEAITCEAGQYLNNDNECVACTAGSYCPGDNVQYACPVDYDGELDPTSPAGATSSNDCYIEKPCPNGTGTQICNYRSSDVADYIDCNACVYTSCDKWFELVDGNSRCQLIPKFTITTTPDTADFFMHIAAAGEFIIDWGGAGTVTVGNNTTAETIGNVSYITKKINDRETLSSTKIAYTYDKPGEYTIKISGLATGYYKDKALPVYSAFRLSDLDGKGEVKTNERVQGIYGSLSAIFPTLANGTNPSFEATFDGCSSIQSTIPTDLFTGLYGEPQIRMFRHTFQGCEKLDGTIPENLFAGIKTNNISEFLFYNTFGGCAELDGEIPGDLFKNFSGAPAKAMFSNTFRGCKSLTGIGEGLFDSISGAPASSMFADTFKGTKNITSIPEGLFVNISGKPANGMFYGTFSGSGITSIPDGLFDSISGAPAENMFFGTFGETNLTTPDGQVYALPADLFKNIEGTSQKGMFDQTFIKCSGLTGYILPEMFAGISDTSVGMNKTFAGTAIATYCPAGMYVSDSWTAEEENSAGVSIGSVTRVACAGCPVGYTSNAGSTSQNQCFTSCTTDCIKPECPENATCEYGSEINSGNRYYGTDSCDAVAQSCSMTFTCKNGYKKTADGTACEKETYTAIYDCNGGSGDTEQQIVYMDEFTINTTVCTLNDHDFLGYKVDGIDVDEDTFTWTYTSDKTFVAQWKKNIVTCNDGEYLPANTEVCDLCLEDHACLGGTYKINQSVDQGIHKCPETSFATGKGNSMCECVAEIKMDGFVALADKQYIYHYETCEYNRGKTDIGNLCNVKNDTCVEYACRADYEMKNGKCQPCLRENALSYKAGENCVVETCKNGFHPDNTSCEPNVIECTKWIGQASLAERKWDYSLGSYGGCVVIECMEGYHVNANACVQNDQECTVDNGVGRMTWDEKTQKWGDCVVTSCSPGYTNDPSETNEVWKQCGRCNNMYAVNGEVAVSAYVKGCEIASCMYPNERYILENNECRPICDTQSDETGSRRWDAESGTCVHECNAGYLPW